MFCRLRVQQADDRVLAGTQFNPGAFLEDTSPYAWALTGVALNIGLSVIGAGW